MLPELTPFAAPVHKPFSLGNSPQQALLIHGFPGTPAEVRPLADLLYRSGWEVHVPLLPGFGPDIANLNQRRRSDWIDAVISEWQSLKSSCQDCLLLGYSMGATLAIHAAAVLQPEKLVLISPFWHAPGIYSLLVPLVRRLAPNIHPFKNADFRDTRLRHIIASIVPDTDLDDPKVQEYIRTRFTLPLAAMEEVIRMGREAYRLAKQIHGETLIIQGSQDPLVQPSNTRQLIGQLGEKQACYYEIQAGHDLLNESSQHFNQLAKKVVDFAHTGCIPLTVSSSRQLQLQHEHLTR